MDTAFDIPNFAYFSLFNASTRRPRVPTGAVNGRSIAKQARRAHKTPVVVRHPASTDYLQPMESGAFGMPSIFEGLQSLQSASST